MSLPNTVFIIAGADGSIAGAFTAHERAAEHVAAFAPEIRAQLTVAEFARVRPPPRPDLSFCEGEERS